MTTLFDTGRKMEPLIYPMPSGELALTKDEITVFLVADKITRKVEQKHSVTFSDAPVALGKILYE